MTSPSSAVPEATPSAEDVEVLVPVRINVVSEDNAQFSDHLLWNLNERQLTPENFARQTCVDLDLPSSYEAPIADSMHSQLNEWRRGLEQVALVRKDRPAPLEDLIEIALDIAIGGVVLRDRFQWDCSSPLSNPESFALTTVKDLELPATFVHAISVSIREQVLRHVISSATQDAPATNADPPVVSPFLTPEQAQARQWGPRVSRRSIP